MRVILSILLVICSICFAQTFDRSNEFDISLLDSQVTEEYPAVGRLVFGTGGFCTATLISPNIVLTAAHCIINPTSLDNPHPKCGTGYESFYSGNLSQSAVFQFKINGYEYNYTAIWGWSFGSTISNDVGVVLLGTPVSKKILKPMKIKNSKVVKGSPSDVIGFGCDNMIWSNTCNQYVADRDGSIGQKQIVERTTGDTIYQLCPGDSGGPWIDVNSNSIYAVSSATQADLSVEEKRNLKSDTSYVADVTSFYSEIQKKVKKYQDSCSIPKPGKNGISLAFGSCEQQSKCESQGFISEVGYCPNHPNGVVCCVNDKSTVIDKL